METMWLTAVAAILIALDVVWAGRQKAKMERMKERLAELEKEE